MDLKLFNDHLHGKTTALVAKRHEKGLAVIEQKRVMLSAPEVQAKLSSVEMSLAEAGTKTLIRFMAEETLVGKVKVMAKGLARDAGIKTWNDEAMQYDYTRFYHILKSYYGDLSIEEVIKAFDLAMVGMLDDYLPKDKNGDPDKNHYQHFSVEYTTKILNAYRKKKGDVWGKVRLALPAPQMVISEEERRRNYQSMVNDIYDAYIAYQRGVSPRFPVAMYIDELITRKHIKALPKPSKDDYEKAYRSMLLDPHLPREQKKRLKEEYAMPNVMPTYIALEAQRAANNRAIARCFDKWIKQGFDLIEKEA